MTNSENDPLIKDGLFLTMRFSTFLWESVKDTKRSSIDSFGVVGDLGEADALMARVVELEVDFEPTYLQTTIRASMSGNSTVAMCSVSGFSSMTAKQSPRRRHSGVNRNDS